MICNIDNILQASQCIYNWLSYLSKASDNSKLIAESALKYPFVEYLERHSINDVHLEVLHPLFKRKRIDSYIGKTKNHTNEIDMKSDQMTFVEFKFVRGDTLSSSEQQRYFDDLLRLSYLKQNFPQCECYFLVCGETFSFNSAFRYDNDYPSPDNKITEDTGGKSSRFPKQSVYNDWLSFEYSQKIKESDLTKIDKKFISSFNSEYLSKEEEKAIVVKEIQKFRTKLISIYPAEGDINASYSLGLWQIE